MLLIDEKAGNQAIYGFSNFCLSRQISGELDNWLRLSME